MLLFILLGLLACKGDTEIPAEDAPHSASAPAQTVTSPEEEEDRPSAVVDMESSMGVDTYHAAAAVSYRLDLSFGGKPRFQGTVLQTGDMSRIHLSQPGEEMVFDGSQVHVKTAGAFDSKTSRFNALTWPYFFSLPFKLDDPGTVLEPMDPQEIEGVSYQRVKLTFKPGTGDAPDDWYLLYLGADGKLAAAAYIVTFGGRSAAEAANNAHVVRYADYEQVDGVWFSRKWTFHNWSETAGWEELLGEATLSDVKLLAELPANAFAIPEGAIAVGSPRQ